MINNISIKIAEDPLYVFKPIEQRFCKQSFVISYGEIFSKDLASSSHKRVAWIKVGWVILATIADKFKRERG